MNRLTWLFFIGFFIHCNNGYSQFLNEADKFFSYFEYEKAASIYESYGVDQLNLQRLENLAMCHYFTFNGLKGLPIANALIEKKSTEANYYLWKARFLKENGDYAKAKIAAQKYKELNGKESIKSFVESCDLWMESPQNISGTLENSTLNDKYANFQSYNGSTSIYFKERGLDSNYMEVNLSDGLNAEVLLLTPFILHEGNLIEWKLINEPGKYFSINSIQVSESLQKVYFSAALPLESNAMNNSFQIYEADFHGFDVAVTNIQRWNLLGEDSSTCSQIALSQDEKLLVFAKLGNATKGADLYFSEYQDGKWGIAKSLINLNSDGDDLFPVFDGDSLFNFSSNGRKGYGELDIYSCKLTGQLEDLQMVDHAPLPINSGADDFNYYHYSQDAFLFGSNRKIGKGDDDVWKFVNDPVIITIPEPEPFVEKVKVPNIDSLLNEWNKERAHAGFDKDDSEENFSYLNDLKELMKQGYTFHIEVIGSADNRGSDEYNDALGLRRAEARKNLLIQDGIPNEILEVKTIGAKEPVADCPQRGKCSESVHEQNRFVRLKITQVK